MPGTENNPNPYASPTAESRVVTARPGEKEYAPCPACGNRIAKKISWTLWGGLVGPALLTHVRCAHCGTAYNGKTGKSNSKAITIFVAAGIVGGVVLGLLFAISNHH